MIDEYFPDPVALKRFREGPLGAYLHSFAELVSSLGYVKQTVRFQFQHLDRLARWLKSNGA